VGKPSGGVTLTFTPKSGAVATKWAIIGPNRAPTGANGTQVFIAAVDASGEVDTGYTGGPVTFTQNLVAVVTPVDHTFVAADNGQFLVNITDSTAQTITLTVSDGTITDGTFPIEFTGVTQYFVYHGGTKDTSFTSQGTSMNFTIRAADGSSNIVRSYNETATFAIESETGLSNASITGGNTITFIDGIAEITLNKTDNPTVVTFSITEVANSSIETDVGHITVNFQASDSTAPEIVRVEMDTPWIVHIYFSEDVESASAGVEGNYQVSGAFGNTIDKVCWYGDNVTLNLNAIPGSLGGTFNLAIQLVKDTTGNAIAADPGISESSISIPNVDFQGLAGATNDWFEVEASDTTPNPGDTILIKVYHKNVCGYLTGDNSVNKNTTVGNASISYDGGGGSTTKLDGEPSTVGVGDGEGEFSITIAAGTSGQSLTISVSDSGVSTSTILTLNIQ